MQFGKKLVLSLLAIIPLSLAEVPCHTQLGGQCIDIYTQPCSGTIYSGYCNGGNNIRCCVL